MAMTTRKELNQFLRAKFASHNDNEVTQATITREEYEAILNEIKALDRQVEVLTTATTEFNDENARLSSIVDAYDAVVKFQIKHNELVRGLTSALIEKLESRNILLESSKECKHV